MLGKLLKHEFKAVNRLMIPLHLGLILITIVGRFYVQFVMNRPHVNYSNYTLRMWEGLMDVLLISAYVIALIAIFIITWLYLDILRFRKNLFTDEGYLMHTLPASAAEHIAAKLTVSTVWQIVDGFLIGLSVFIMVINKSIIRELALAWRDLVDSFSMIFGVPAVVGVPSFLLMLLLDTMAGTLIIYMCIAIGHSFNSHKNFLVSILSVLTGFGSFGNYNMSTFFFGVTSYNSVYHYGMSEAGYFWLNVGFSTILSLVVGVAAFVLINHFMTKRLNLE